MFACVCLCVGESVFVCLLTLSPLKSAMIMCPWGARVYVCHIQIKKCFKNIPFTLSDVIRRL